MDCDQGACRACMWSRQIAIVAEDMRVNVACNAVMLSREDYGSDSRACCSHLSYNGAWLTSLRSVCGGAKTFGEIRSKLSVEHSPSH